jgi:hypothetical protein
MYKIPEIINGNKTKYYLPYLSLAYNILQARTSVMEFHMITAGKPSRIP